MTLVVVAAMVGGCDRDKQDRLDESAIADAANQQGDSTTRDDRCAAAGTNRAIKADLFRRAAEVRGSNAVEYAQIAGYSLLLIDAAAPVEEVGLRDAVDCRGHATLRLPPGLQVAGGRTTLVADIGYSVASGGAATLDDVDEIVVPLATLAKIRAAVPVAPSTAPAPATPPDPLAPRPAMPAPPPPAPATVAFSDPSFDCARARSRSEIAVCANPRLGALDRAMANRYVVALTSAPPETISLLQRTRDDFLRYRDRCADDACIANTYRGRMREIADIAAGRWRGR